MSVALLGQSVFCHRRKSSSSSLLSSSSPYSITTSSTTSSICPSISVKVFVFDVNYASTKLSPHVSCCMFKPFWCQVFNFCQVMFFFYVLLRTPSPKPMPTRWDLAHNELRADVALYVRVVVQLHLSGILVSVYVDVLCEVMFS